MFQTMGQRAWHAYYCLERDEKGKPPAYRQLEEANDLNNGEMMKLLKGILKRPGLKTITNLANALRVTPQYLQFGEGQSPKSAWPIPAYPYGSSDGLSTADKAAFDRDAKKLSSGGLTRRTKSARK